MNTLFTLAGCRAAVGDSVGAFTGFAELVATQSRFLGPDDTYTLASRHQLELSRDRDDLADTVTALAEVLADQQRVLGPEHPDALATRRSIADVRGQAGDPAGAVAALKELLTIHRRLLGRDHSDTAMVRDVLAYWRTQIPSRRKRRAIDGN
jgi:hypothetical protein